MTSPAVTRAGREAKRAPEPRRRTALALPAVAQLVLDVTVVNVALPDIGTSLRLTRAEPLRGAGDGRPAR